MAGSVEIAEQGSSFAVGARDPGSSPGPGSIEKRRRASEAVDTLSLTVSIVTANNKQLILDCLRSIYETTRDLGFEIFVVSNDSSDDSEDAIKRRMKVEAI